MIDFLTLVVTFMTVSHYFFVITIRTNKNKTMLSFVNTFVHSNDLNVTNDSQTAENEKKLVNDLLILEMSMF